MRGCRKGNDSNITLLTGIASTTRYNASWTLRYGAGKMIGESLLALQAVGSLLLNYFPGKSVDLISDFPLENMASHPAFDGIAAYDGAP